MKPTLIRLSSLALALLMLLPATLTTCSCGFIEQHACDKLAALADNRATELEVYLLALYV